MVAEAEYNIFARAAVGFVDTGKGAKDWPDWAKEVDINKPEVKKKEVKTVELTCQLQKNAEKRQVGVLENL